MTGRRILALLAVLAVAIGAAWWATNRPATADPTGVLPVPGSVGTALLIPGYGGGTSQLGPLARSFTAAGWATETLNIGRGEDDLAGYGSQARARAQQISLATGRPVVLVGYSAGGLIARSAIDQGAEPYVSRVVTIGSPHAGTKIAGLGAAIGSPACPLACQQMAPGSDFLAALPVAGDPTRWLAIYSDTDGVVVPDDSAALPGATVAMTADLCPSAHPVHGDLPTAPTVIDATVQFATSGTVPTGCS